jgi:AcrR family transcriptional regulator
MPDDLPTRGEQTRAAIIQAAHALFIQQGYHGTSMRQIAGQAGIALGGLYNHFASKEAVFQSVFLAYHPYHQVLPALLQADGDSIEALVHNAIGCMIQALQDHPDFLNLMFIEIVEFKNVHTQELLPTLLPQGIQIIQRFTQKDPSRLRPIPFPMIVRSFLGLFFAYFLTELVFASSAPPEFRQDALYYLTDVYLHGILIRERTI